MVTVEGAGLAGVIIRLAGASVQETATDAQGSFTFVNVPVGSYSATISNLPLDVEFPISAVPVTVADDATVTIAFTGNFVRASVIRGRVLGDGLGVAGQSLTLEGPESRTTTSDAAGAYSFERLAPGTYTVRLTDLDGSIAYGVTEVTVTIGVRETLTVDFTGVVIVPASLRLVGIEDAETGNRLNVDNLSGDLRAVINVEQGTQTVTTVRVRLNGEVVGSENLSAAAVARPAARSAAIDRVNIEFSTDDFDPATGEARFTNGDYLLRIEADTQEDGANAAVIEEAITIANLDRFSSMAFVTGQSVDPVVSGGREWWGNRDLAFSVVPILYSGGTTIGSIDVIATSDASIAGGPGLDFGSGPGVAHRVEGPTFGFTASLADNRGIIEDAATGRGHTVSIVAVYDPEGQNITTQFLGGLISFRGLYFDFRGPTPGPSAKLLVAGIGFAADVWYSGAEDLDGDGAADGGPIGLDDVTEGGVGGLSVTLDASVGGEVILSGVTSIADLPERKREYVVQVASLSDLLGNSTDVSTIPPSPTFGVDRTPVALTEVWPKELVVLNPDDDLGDGLDDNVLLFEAADPLLADESSGSGYKTARLIATAEDGVEFPLTVEITPNAAGANEAALPIPDGVFDVELSVDDNARRANTVVQPFQVILDSTDPRFEFRALQGGNQVSAIPTSWNATTSVWVWQFAGAALDENGISSAIVRFRDAGANGLCDVTDALIPTGTDPGYVERNNILVTESADLFEIEIRVRNPGVTTTQFLCTFIEIEDTATDVFGSDEPNFGAFSAKTVLNWN